MALKRFGRFSVSEKPPTVKMRDMPKMFEKSLVLGEKVAKIFDF